MGYQVTLGEAFRPEWVAAIYAQQHKGILHSNHTERLAIDLNLFDSSGNLLPYTGPAYATLGAWWKGQSDQGVIFCWGGDWGDSDHFSFENEGIK